MANSAPEPDVIVVGLGPAGRALAHRCRAAGLAVTAVDPHPDRPWAATYGAWSDELPDWLDPSAIAAAADSPAVHTAKVRRLRRRYVVFDSPELQRSLSLEGVRVLTARADEVVERRVTLRDGAVLTAPVVVDARGLIGQKGLPEQTAYGLVVSAAAAAPALQGQQAWFMDWRQDHHDPGRPDGPRDARPSFLYAVPLADDRVLLEETCLAGQPAIEVRELQRRLRSRLRNRGVPLTGDEVVEIVRFPLHPRGKPGQDAFGARSGMAHPATGYSVAAALAWADAATAAIGRGDRVGSALWPRGSGTVRALRIRGLAALQALPPADLPVFFDAFFKLPERRQRDFLSNRTSITAAAVAMMRVFVGLPPRLQARVAVETARGGRQAD